VDGVAEGDLHQRVEPARGLVEDEQVGAAGEGRDELHLLAVALRQRPHLLGDVEFEALDERVAVGHVGGAAHAREERERLGARQRRPQVGLAGDVRDAAVRRHGVAPGVDAEEARAPARRPMQAEQQADGRRLAGPVGPEVPVHLAGPDLEVQVVEGQGRAVALGQALGLDRARHAGLRSALPGASAP
jgi:hypothetical protein